MNIGDAAHWAKERSLAAALVMLAVAFAGLASAAERSADSDISDFMLENGMQVVVIPDHRAPVVTHMVWYKVGSADEPPGKSGIAHFFEHLMFKGTTNHKPGEFAPRSQRSAAAKTPSPHGTTPPSTRRCRRMRWRR